MQLNRVVSILVLGLVAAVLMQNTVAQETSTPEERAQWAAITHKLESAPLRWKMDIVQSRIEPQCWPEEARYGGVRKT